MGMEKTIEIKAIDKEKALKRALNILGVELSDNGREIGRASCRERV